MKITILTLFPDLFSSYLTTSIPSRAVKKNLAEYETVDIRQYGEGRHQVVDGRPFGGGAGMVLRADILAKAYKSVVKSKTSQKTILMSASGTPYKQKKAWELSKLDHLIIICGHYEGLDQRFIDKYVDEEISIGDYVLSGGEIPAQVIIDSVVRLIPGVLKKPEATKLESFSSLKSPDSKIQLLEYPQYTRPNNFDREDVPQVLISGNHQEVEKWRLKKAIEKTKKFRPDLIKGVSLS